MKKKLGLGGIMGLVLMLFADAKSEVTSPDYRLGERGLINFDLAKPSEHKTPNPSIDLNKINSSRETQKSAFDALDTHIKKLEEFAETICQEIKTLKQNLEETKQAVQAHNDGLTRSLEAKTAEVAAIMLDTKTTSTQTEPNKDVATMTEVVTVTVCEAKPESPLAQ